MTSLGACLMFWVCTLQGSAGSHPAPPHCSLSSGNVHLQTNILWVLDHILTLPGKALGVEHNCPLALCDSPFSFQATFVVRFPKCIPCIFKTVFDFC